MKAKKIEAQIKALQAKLETLKSEPRMVPTGKFTLEVRNNKGEIIHTIEGFESRRDAQLESNIFYKVLVTKLKQKVSLYINPEMKRQA